MKFTDKIIILDNLRSAYNTGSIYRTAYSFDFKTIVHVGTTPNIDNPSFISASRGVEKNINTLRYDSIDKIIEELKELNFRIYALEISDRSQNIESLKLESPYAIVLGNEALGVSQYALSESDKIIEINTINKRSLNVSIAFGIFAYSDFIRSINE